MKNCIFHIPYKLDPNAKAAPMLRPRKMIEAFEKNGYRVDVISGFSAEREALIEKVKNKILDGVEYDFMYAESSTMPMLLSDPGHMPTHPFMDFDFFSFVKQHGIKIGLFYRDVYWKFDIYKKSLPYWKYAPAMLCYKYELKQYGKYLDRLYIPTEKFYDYIDMPVFDGRVSTLPPGCELTACESAEKKDRDYSAEPLKIFYVGGLGEQYQINELLIAVRETENCELTVCCRQDEWEKEKEKLIDAMCDRVQIVHKSGDELKAEYEKADICSLLFKPDLYRQLAMPYKAFEYLSNLKPVMASRETAIGDFVENNNIGWTIEYSAEEIKALLSGIMTDGKALGEKKASCIRARENNLWTRRATKVSEELSAD